MYAYGLQWPQRLLPYIVFNKNKIKLFNTLRSAQNVHYFANYVLEGISANVNVWLPFQYSIEFDPKGLVRNKSALFQVMAGR